MTERRRAWGISRRAWAGRKSFWRASIASALALGVLGYGSGGAQGTAAVAAMPDRDVQNMVYEVFAGGINAVTAEMEISLSSPERYDFIFNARTRGFLHKIVPWTGTFESHGWRLKNGNMPELHKTTSVWRGEADSHEYKYARNGSFLGMKSIIGGEDVTPKDLTPELTDGTTDILTATLAVMEKVAEKGECSGSSEVFDGARRFALVFSHEADEVLEATDYNIYGGPAARCTVEVKPISGKWHEKPRGWMSIQEQGRARGTMPTVWMAKVEGNGPAVPVKVRVKTGYGTLFMHLNKYKNGKTNPATGANDQ